jgi:two-component system cell cycle response regulator DivK
MKKVMLVEDDATMVGLLNILLEMEGFGVVKMVDEDADHLLETIREERPDVILMDVNLRQMNGFDLLQRIKDEEDIKTVKVLMSSGIDFQEACSKAGADGFILKPYMPDALIQQIRQMAS